MHYSYRARLESMPEGGFLATFPDVPAAIASGETRPAALAQAVHALVAGLTMAVEAGESLPQPKAKTGTSVAVPAPAALKIAVIDAFNASNMTKSALGAALGKSEAEARRILDPDHATKLPMLEAALAALGKKVLVSVEDA